MSAGQGSWGGQRAGAGRKSAWRSGSCKAVKIPLALVDQVLAFARQLDEGQHPPQPTATPARSEALARLQAENDELRDRLAAALVEIATLRPTAQPAPSPAEQPPTSSADTPSWLHEVRKRILAQPKPATRLMVISLVLGHHAYTEERLHEHERRPLAAGASPRLREEWRSRQLALHRRLLHLDQLFAALPQDLVEEARGLRVNWGTRAASGAKRSYDALLERMGRA